MAALESSIRMARRLGELVPLGELVRRHIEGRNTSRLIALTFDDAYAALGADVGDVVRREAIPVAIFAVTAAASTGATYWWDRIDDLFPRVGPDRWRAFEQACGLPDEYRRGQPKQYGPLRPLRQWLLARHAGRWPGELEPAIHALERETGSHTVHRSMTFDELAAVAESRNVEVGLHTASHPVLPLLSDEELRQEIAGGYRALRDRFPKVLPILSIPFGLYDARTLRTAREAGMIASLTLAGGPLNGRTPFRGLPRLCVTRDDTPLKVGIRLLGLPEMARRWSGHRGAPMYPDLPSATT